MPTIVNVDVRELSGEETGVDYSSAVIDFWPYRKAHIEDGGEDYLLSANILRVRIPDGETTVVLPPTPVGNALWVQERSFKGATKYLVSIPDQSEVNLWDLPHLNPDSLDPEAAPSPAWLETIIAVQGELDATTEAAQDAQTDATAALTGLGDKADTATLDPTIGGLIATPGSDVGAAVTARIAVAKVPDTAITYDTDGNVDSVTEDGLATTYTYNPDGSVATDSVTIAGDTITRSYTYDGDGNLTEIEAA